METTTTTQNTQAAPAGAPAAQPAAAPFGGRGGFQSRDGDRGQGGPRRGGRRPGGPRQDKERVKPEFDSKIISIRRVTRVVSGGRRFSFSVAVVAGDRKGRVGVGLGKAGDTSLAIDKATRDAKKNMIKVAMTASSSIPHSVEAKFNAARVSIMPAKGRGIIAGSSVRNVIELSGLKDVCAKLFSGSKNKVNNARAAIHALSNITKHSKVATLTKTPAAK